MKVVLSIININYRIIKDTNRLFCPLCGNSSLLRVAMYNNNGVIKYGNLPKKVNLKGTIVYKLIILVFITKTKRW